MSTATRGTWLDRRPAWQGLAGFAFLACLVRLAAGTVLSVRPLTPDYAEYVALARGLAGGTFRFPQGWEQVAELAASPWRYLYVQEAATVRPPGWPAALALQGMLGGTGPAAHFGLSLVLDGISTLALGWAAHRLWGGRAGLLAAGLMALSPGAIYACLVLGREPLLTLTLSLALVGTVEILRRPSPLPGLWAGLAFGMGGLVKETALVLGACTGVWLLGLAWRRRSRPLLLAAAGMACGAVLAIGPWLARNAAVTGRAEISSLAGVNLMLGLVADDAAAFQAAQPAGWRTQHDPYLAPTPQEADRRLRQVVGAFASAHPLRIVAHGLENVALFWSPVPRQVYTTGRLDPASAVAGLVNLLVFGLGVLQMWRLRRSPWVLLVGVSLVLLTLAHAPFIGWPRFRIPFETLLLLIGASVLGRPHQAPATR